MTHNEEIILHAAQRLAADLRILETALETHRKYRRGDASESELRAAELRTRLRKTILELGAIDDGI